MGTQPGDSARDDMGGGRPRPRGRGAGGGALSDRVWVMDRVGLAEVDRLAVEEFGIPSFALMENAAAGLAGETLAMLGQLDRNEVVIVCGPGNNGGDGLAAARHLHNAGAQVQVVLTGNPAEYRSDAATNHAIVRAMGIKVYQFEMIAQLEHSTPAVVIDAVFGTGLTREIEGVHAEAVREINRLGQSGARVIAADVPSGLDADTGKILGGEVCVAADLTVTFAALKFGFGRLSVQRVLGEVVVVEIGCPSELLDRFGERVELPPGHDSPEPRIEESHRTEPGAGRQAGDEEPLGENEDSSVG